MRIYFDHNATTPLRDEVAEAVARAQRDLPGNASSAHAEGRAARAALERARETVAGTLGARPAELVFTSGATESNNLALHGLAHAGGRRHLVTSAAEHPSVEEPIAALEAEGFRVTRVGVDRDGLLDPDAVGAALAPDTALVSILWANNETGAIQPIEAIAAHARAQGVPIHVDATQALGKIPVRVDAAGVDLLSASAHKLNGPKGTGLLVVRGERTLAPWMCGGSQEQGRRGGTSNVPGAIGLALACELAARELGDRARHTGLLRDRLWDGIVRSIAGVRRNGRAEHTLPNTLSVEFTGAPGDVLLEALDLEGVAVSAGAACAAGAVRPSRTLLAMGRTADEARATLRFSVGHGNSEAEIDRVLAILPSLVARVRDAERAVA
jgi:cysteine desulfurase